jgi:DNA repair exonuclease SbcCD nuclease subunit
MQSLPELSIGVLNDIHVGGPVGGGFQNTFLTADATEILKPAVDAINHAGVDLTLIPGDLTHDATGEQLSSLSRCLHKLNAPFMACKGNHDRESSEGAARFDEAINTSARAGITWGERLGLAQEVAILVLESSWKKDGQPYEPDNPPLAIVDDGLIEQVLSDLDRRKPQLLLVVSHYPLVSQAEYVATVRGNYAGHVEGGDELITQLVARAGTVLCFCGHNHYHHIMAGERWLQCGTGALLEYPAEFRIVTVRDNQVTVTTSTAARSLLKRAPAPAHEWVAGRAQDREITWRSE